MLKLKKHIISIILLSFKNVVKQHNKLYDEHTESLNELDKSIPNMNSMKKFLLNYVQVN